MAFTLNEIILLVIALLVGLVLGLMMSGRGKYKRLWRDEQMAHRQTIKGAGCAIGRCCTRQPGRSHGAS